MRKTVLVVALTMVFAEAVFAALPAKNAFAIKLVAPELATWPRMKATDFGCMLEKRFGIQDPRYGCSADFDRMDWGDACLGATTNYNVGPELPPSVAKSLPSPISAVELEWEHGELQHLSVEFDRKVSAREVEALFGLRLGDPKPDNLMSVDLQDCALEKSCLTLQGFDHMGAADFECGT
jgi:hypothetical protein